MKTYRVTLEAPKRHFEITYDLDVSVDQHEFWGQKFDVKNHRITNARASIVVPECMNLFDSDVHALEMACGDKYYGEFVVDIPAAAFDVEDEETWIDRLADSIPAEWQIVNWKTI